MLSPLRMPFRHARVASYLRLRIIKQPGELYTLVSGARSLREILSPPRLPFRHPGTAGKYRILSETGAASAGETQFSEPAGIGPQSDVRHC